MIERAREADERRRLRREALSKQIVIRRWQREFDLDAEEVALLKGCEDADEMMHTMLWIVRGKLDAAEDECRRLRARL